MQEGGWLGLAAILVTGVLGLLQVVVKQRHDTRLLELAEQNRAQGAQIASNTAALKECREEHGQTKELLETTRKALAEQTLGENRRLQQQIDAQGSGLAALKKQVNGGGGSGPHAPLPPGA